MAKQRRIPFRIHVLRRFFVITGVIWPWLGASVAYRLWFRVFAAPEPPRERSWREAAKMHYIESEGSRIAVYRWGSEGPVVLLVHGWGGRGTQLGSMVEPLLQAGYRVVGFDGPAHGRSDGSSTSLPAYALALETVQRSEGSLHAIVAHSFGAMVVQYAISHLNVVADRVVTIGSPSSIQYLVDSFSTGLKINKAIIDGFSRRFEADYGDDLWERFSLEALVPGESVPSLIIHDENDNDVPVTQGEVLHRAWAGSELQLTQKLGHWRILRDESVVQQVISFLKR